MCIQSNNRSSSNITFERAYKPKLGPIRGLWGGGGRDYDGHKAHPRVRPLSGTTAHFAHFPRTNEALASRRITLANCSSRSVGPCVCVYVCVIVCMLRTSSLGYRLACRSTHTHCALEARKITNTENPMLYLATTSYGQ